MTSIMVGSGPARRVGRARDEVAGAPGREPGAMGTIFFTGFPGFLGSRLLPKALERDADAVAACLVQAKFAGAAQERLAELERSHPSIAGRVELVEGDLTVSDLGLLDRGTLAASTTEIYHLAAVYDLSVPRALGMRVNVDGTRNLLRFAEDCPDLRRHHYVSTCYVSGRYCGPYKETDLDRGQSFNNFYEETKFLAEVEVDRARAGGMPTTVYRPAIVVGDSRTGDTQKYDGPYFLLQWMLRQGKLAIVPYVGDPSMVRFNVVPSDFVLDAIAYLSGIEESVGVTYQLADPRPLTVDEVLTAMLQATGKRGIRVPLPHKPTTWMLDHVDALERFIGIPSSAIEYFLHPTHYDTTNADRDLAGSDVSCPPFGEYLPALVRFMEAHRNADVGVMV
jgi:thioester reductase-like protein